MPVSEATFEAVVLEDTDGRWELHRGRLREKPPMSYGHNRSARRLHRQLVIQLDPDEYDVLLNDGHLWIAEGASYVPDVAVVPASAFAAFEGNPRQFEEYAVPPPFVAEAWSPKTGTFDVETKFPAYRHRGDQEIWRVHPFEQTVTAWRRQPDGTYSETVVGGGIVELPALPWVRIDVDRLFLPR
jgi:Uma2 family endonuclease